jgi:hypothetical protein
MPAGFVAGDLLIGIAMASNGTAPSARPSGSTLVRNVASGTVFSVDVVRKTAVGGDVFTWTIGTARKWAGCVIAVTTGTWNTTTPINIDNGVAQGATSATTYATPTVTVTTPDGLAISAFGNQAQSTWSTADTNPAMTEICDQTSTGTTPASCGVYRSNAAPAAAGLTRSATATVASASACMWLGVVNPSPAVLRPPRRRGPQYRR